MAILPTTKGDSKGKFTGKPLSKVIWSEVVGDLTKPFVLNIKASSASAQDYQQDFFDQTDVTQRFKATSGKYDILKLMTNPGEFAKDLVKNTTNEIFNKDDLLSNAEVESVWQPIIKGDPSKLRGHDGRVMHQALAHTYGGSMSFEDPSLKGITKPGTKKVSVRDRSAPGGWRVQDDPEDVELFSKAGDATLDFIKDAKDKGGRNKAYRAMQLSHLEALNGSIDHNATVAASPEAALFKTHLNLANSVGALEKELGNTSSALAKGTSQNMLFERTEKTKQAEWAKKLLEADKKTGKTPQQQLDALNDLITKTRMDLATSLGSLSGSDLAETQQAGQAYDKYLAKMQDSIGRLDITNQKGLSKIVASLEEVSEGLVNPNYFDGVGGRLIDAVHDMHVVRDAKGFSTKVDGGGMLQRWGIITKGKYERFGADDAVQTLMKGMPEIFDDYIWSKYKKRVLKYTPQEIVSKVVKATHNFGLSYEEDQMKKKGFYGFLARNFAKAVPEYKFRIKTNGMNFTTSGGAHFEGALTLYKLLKAGNLNGVMSSSGPTKGTIEAFVDPAKIGDLISLINDGVPDGFKIDGKDFKDIEKGLNEFRDWLHEHGGSMGIRFVGGKIDTTSLSNANNIVNVINFIQRKKSNPDLIDPTQIKAGILQRYTSLVAQTQTKYFAWLQTNFLGKWVYKYNNYKEALAQAFANWLYGTVVAGSGGLGALAVPFKKAINVLARYVVNTGDKLVKGLFKGDISKVVHEIIDELVNAFDKTAEVIVKTTLYVFFSMMFLIYFVFAVLLSVINPSDEARANGLEVFDVGLGGPYSGSIADCINLPDTSNFGSLAPASGAIGNAQQIASGLLRGFWCAWNHHPAYPQYWNPTLFAQDPNPSSGISCGNCLFWCTALPIESYDGGIPGSLLNSQSMAIFFGYVDNDVVANGITNELADTVFIANTPDGIGTWGIEPGDVIFFQTPARFPERIAHVAMVYSADQDGVETIHSNAWYKEYYFPRNPDGTVQSFPNNSGGSLMNVIGFGRFK